MAATVTDESVIEKALLQALSEGPIEDSGPWGDGNSFDQAALNEVIKRLQAKSFIVTTTIENQQWRLTAEGEACVEAGSPEARVFAFVPEEGAISKDDLVAAVVAGGGDAKLANLGAGKAVAAKWLTTEKKDKTVYYSRASGSIEDAVQAKAVGLATLDAAGRKELKKRRMAECVVAKTFAISPGPDFATERAVGGNHDLDAAMIASGEWENDWTPVNIDGVYGAPIPYGTLHPLLKVRTQFREIFLEMGFEEMPTNNFVESAFWNFDALFQPQQHPARDAHDTFFLSEPSRTLDIPADYAERVKEVHETGGYGSIGYRYDWSEDEARKNILRTHTTAVSSQMLYRLATLYKEEEVFTPKKYFSIDRVFRNETLDQTHLAEFHQIEGFIADYNVSLGDLIGMLNLFFQKLGIPKLRFKPAYNPYTEPSMEIFGFNEMSGEWLELGNSGVFRPEMLRPMGLPEGVGVIAWGLGLERPTMLKYGIRNIRDLLGHKVNFEMIRTNPICDITLDRKYEAL